MPRLFCLLLVLWVLTAPNTGVCDTATEHSFQALLEQADAVRSSDPQQLDALLSRLKTQSAQATPAQRELLRYLQAYQLVIASKYAEAISEAEALAAQTSAPAMQFRAGLLLVTAHAATRDFASGLTQLARTLKLIDSIADKDLRHRGLITAAVLYNQLGQYALGRANAERVLADAPEARSRCFAGHLLAEADHFLGRATASEATLRSVIEDCSVRQEAVAANLTRAYLIQQWAAAGKLDAAITELRAHQDEVSRTQYPHLIALFHALLASYLEQRGDALAAEREAHRALASTEAASFSIPRVSAWRTLYQIALRRRDATTALEYYRNFAESDRAYLDDVKAREMAYQLAQLEAQQKEHTIALLAKQNEVLTLEQQVTRQAARFNRLLVGVLLLLLLAIGYWAWKVKRVQNVFRHLAQIDALTGVNNRHHFHQQALQALQKCAENRLVATLVMFDLDHFKSVNDTYGHATGDWVLKAVADTARRLCRDRDYIGRLGGEEFALLLIGTELAQGLLLAEQCRASIAAIDTSASGHRFVVNASFGVSTSSIAGHDLRLLLAQADNAVYRAKHDGRDRVHAYGDSDLRDRATEPTAAGPMGNATATG